MRAGELDEFVFQAIEAAPKMFSASCITGAVCNMTGEARTENMRLRIRKRLDNNFGLSCCFSGFRNVYTKKVDV